jgi:circadian clock protein KaiB
MADYVLTLYVLGKSPKSEAAVYNLRRLCEEELPGQYELEIVDVVQHPERAEQDRILATPTLIKRSPVPVFRVVGDMSLTEKVRLGLGLGPRRGTTQRGVE